MIVPMKKYTFLVFHSEYTDFLNKLRDLGVLHITKKRSEEQPVRLESQFQLVKRYEQALRFLEQRDVEKKESSATSSTALGVLVEVESLQQKEEQIREKIALLRKEIRKVEPWGNYQKEEIENLEKEGFLVRLYTCPLQKFNKQWREQYTLIEINRHKGILYFAVVASTGEEIQIDAEPEALAMRSLADLRSGLDYQNKRITEINVACDELARTTHHLLEQGKDGVIKDIEYESVLIDTDNQAEGSLKLLEGWVPVPREEKLVQFLDQSEYYYISSKPGKEDMPPIQLENNRFSKLAEPVGKLFDLPGYFELDLTPFFAPFFMLFFGFCLGDAGYGLIFVAVALILRGRVNKRLKPIFSLAFYLGLATVILGGLSGTFLGLT
jgi:V/A-type H+-transporting ATPase subunit I